MTNDEEIAALEDKIRKLMESGYYDESQKAELAQAIGVAYELPAVSWDVPARSTPLVNFEAIWQLSRQINHEEGDDDDTTATDNPAANK